MQDAKLISIWVYLTSAIKALVKETINDIDTNKKNNSQYLLMNYLLKVKIFLVPLNYEVSFDCTLKILN